jgi:dihydrofolate reductase
MIAIAAVDRDWGIGRGGRLPWRLPGDLAYFRERTAGSVVIMGRRTFESLAPEPGGVPRPLPGRMNVVLTRNADCAAESAAAVHAQDYNCDSEGFALANSTCEVMRIAERAGQEGAGVYVCGGAEIYRLLMPYTDTCLITRVDACFESDAFFPDLDQEVFAGPDGDIRRCTLISESEPHLEKDLLSGMEVTYRFCEYRIA